MYNDVWTRGQPTVGGVEDSDSLVSRRCRQMLAVGRKRERKHLLLVRGAGEPGRILVRGVVPVPVLRLDELRNAQHFDYGTHTRPRVSA